MGIWLPLPRRCGVILTSAAQGRKDPALKPARRATGTSRTACRGRRGRARRRLPVDAPPLNQWHSRFVFKHALARIDHQAPGCGLPSLMLRVLALGSARAGCSPSRSADPCRRLLSLNDWRHLACGCGDRSGLAPSGLGACRTRAFEPERFRLSIRSITMVRKLPVLALRGIGLRSLNAAGRRCLSRWPRAPS